MGFKKLILLLIGLQVFLCSFDNKDNNSTLTFLEDTENSVKNKNETEIVFRNLRKYDFSSWQSQKLYDSLNARSDAYNPTSPRYNPSSQYNQGGKSAQLSKERAASMWKELRDRANNQNNESPAPLPRI